MPVFTLISIHVSHSLCDQALERAEGKPKPELSELFTDVYANKPRHLIEQEAELHAHMEKYPHLYKMDGKPH